METIESKLEKILVQVEQNNKTLSQVLDAVCNTTLTAKEAANYLNYSYRHFVTEIKDEIPHERSGKLYRFKIKDLDDFKIKYQ